MAIAQTGSVLEFRPGSSASSGTVSSAITVPADAEIAVVGVAGYAATANWMTAGSMTFTKGGADTAMTVGSNLGNNSTTAFMCSMWYIASPDTGSNKTLKWDWNGVSAVNVPIFSITFWKGINIASAVRSTSGGQSATSTPYTSGTLTAQSLDLIVAYAGGSTGSEGTIDSWSNLSLLAQVTRAAGDAADGAWATGSPSGDTTVAASTDTNFDDGGIVAIVLKPFTAVSQTISPSLFSHQAYAALVRRGP